MAAVALARGHELRHLVRAEATAGSAPIGPTAALLALQTQRLACAELAVGRVRRHLRVGGHVLPEGGYLILETDGCRSGAFGTEQDGDTLPPVRTISLNLLGLCVEALAGLELALPPQDLTMAGRRPPRPRSGVDVEVPRRS